MPSPYGKGVSNEPQQARSELTSVSRLWPDENDGPWLINFRFQLIAGRAECVGVGITSARPPDTSSWEQGGKLPEVGIPLSASLLRDLRIASLITEVRETNAELQEMLGAREEAAAFRAPPPNMRPATVKRLQRVADAYQVAWRRGQPPTKAVAERLKVTLPAATSLVARARAAGLLPATSAGVAAGEPKEGDSGET